MDQLLVKYQKARLDLIEQEIVIDQKREDGCSYEDLVCLLERHYEDVKKERVVLDQYMRW